MIETVSYRTQRANDRIRLLRKSPNSAAQKQLDDLYPNSRFIFHYNHLNSIFWILWDGLNIPLGILHQADFAINANTGEFLKNRIGDPIPDEYIPEEVRAYLVVNG